MLFTSCLYSVLKVCVRRRRHYNTTGTRPISSEQRRKKAATRTPTKPTFFSPWWPAPSHDPPALDVGGIVAAALARPDGAFKGGAGDLRGDGGGRGQGAGAHAGGRRLAQGLGGGSCSYGSRLSQLLSQRQKVTGLFHLDERWGRM